MIAANKKQARKLGLPDPTPSVGRRLTVCVVIATYNHASYVGSAIRSALGQTRVPDEILVIDDGSTDDTSEVLAEFGPPVRVIRQTNQGRSVARNRALDETRCDLILFLDADDILTPTSIERRARVLESNPNCGAIYGDMQLIDARGQSLGAHREFMPGARPSGDIFSELALRCFILLPALFRRSLLGNDRFDASLSICEDYDLWRRLAARGRFQYDEEPVAYYRLHGGNTITTQSRGLLEAELEIQRRFFTMPRFRQLSRRERARAYCYHGVKCAVLGRMGAARGCLAAAALLWPFAPSHLGLFGLSLLGRRALPWVVLRRRQLNRRHLADVVPTTDVATSESSPQLSHP